MSQRTCATDECGMGSNGVYAHTVQVVDDPSQVLALQAWDNISVFVPAKEVSELVAKMRRSSVETAECLQGTGQSHGGGARGLTFKRSCVESCGERQRRTGAGIDDLGIRRVS